MTATDDGAPGTNGPPTSAPVVSARDLSVDLGGLPVLRGVDVAVRPGESVALLGGNGSGKSTLVRALLGLTPHSRGEVELFGRSLRRFRAWRRVGYVPQRSTATQSGATVAEVVGTGRLALRAPFVPPGRADRRAVAAALELVGMAGRSGSDVRHLSGGQQQRVMIARALAGEPELLVLDEPIAGVDLEQQRVLAGVLADRLAAGAAVLVVLHEVGELGRLIDRAVVLRDGRVVHDGDPAQLGVAHGRSEHHDHHERASARDLLPGTFDGPDRSRSR